MRLEGDRVMASVGGHPVGSDPRQKEDYYRTHPDVVRSGFLSFSWFVWDVGSGAKSTELGWI